MLAERHSLDAQRMRHPCCLGHTVGIAGMQLDRIGQRVSRLLEEIVTHNYPFLALAAKTHLLE